MSSLQTTPINSGSGNLAIDHAEAALSRRKFMGAAALAGAGFLTVAAAAQNR
jgi:hypothetical protein